MGSWGPGSFENDFAVDWVEDLVDGDDVAKIEGTLRTITAAAPADRLSDHVSCEAVAAAEFVAAARGFPSDELPQWAIDWIHVHRVPSDPGMVTLAIKALQRVAADSELKDLRSESGSLGRWTDALNELERRLLA